MALLSVIRRWAFRDQVSIREISRRTGLSRNTIRKYLRASSVEPKFKILDRPSKLDAFADKLSGWLKSEASKSRKQRRTVKQLHADLISLGYAACGASLSCPPEALLVDFGTFFMACLKLDKWLTRLNQPIFDF